jgi:hypothetical protein
MLKLLRKDLILNGRVIGGAYAFWSLVWLGGPAMGTSGDLTFGVWGGVVSLPCSFLPVIMAIREDKFRAGALACSLPVTRDAIVASRYLGGWLVALAAVAIAVLAMLGLSFFGVRPLLPPTPMLPVIVGMVVGISLAAMMPVAIRYGAAGVIGLLVGLQVLGVVVLLAGSLFGVFLPGAVGVESAVRAVARGGARLRGAIGSVAFSAVLVAGMLALNYASFRLSSWLYRRREF